MDPNLTQPIIINTTLNQPPQSILSSPAITTLLGVVIGWLLNFSTSMIQEKRRSKINNIQKRKQLYSQVRGLSYSLPTAKREAYTSLIIWHWLSARAKFDLPDLPEYGDTKDYIGKAENWELESAKSSQALWEAVGHIQVIFPPSNKLSSRIEKLEKMIKPVDEVFKEFIEAIKGADKSNIDSIPDEFQDLITKKIEETIMDRIDCLAKCLKTTIETEENSLKKSNLMAIIPKKQVEKLPPSQSAQNPRDIILSELDNHDGWMKKGDLACNVQLGDEVLDGILQELVDAGKMTIIVEEKLVKLIE